MFFEGMSKTRAQTLVLRGANDFFLEEVERSLHDSMCVIKRVLESNSIVAGGGSALIHAQRTLDQLIEAKGGDKSQDWRYGVLTTQ